MEKKMSAFKVKQKEAAVAWLAKLDDIPMYRTAVSGAKITHLNMDSLHIEANHRYDQTDVSVYNQDVAVCARTVSRRVGSQKRVCVLDFASYFHPGGGFVNGAMAQEEAICASSGLYPILQRVAPIYETRKALDDKSGLYKNDIFYCENVPFMKSQTVITAPYLIDVMVVAAPNKSACRDKARADIAMQERMNKLFPIPNMFGVDILLLGAFGCGVFGNDLELVAKEWKRLTERYNGIYEGVVHPILDKQQYREFLKYVR